MSEESRRKIEEKRKALVGMWQKVTATPCAEKYPDDLEFHERGTYFGKKGPGDFTWWDVGSYEVLAEDHVKISTATDAVIPYEFLLSGNTLTFVDQDQCQFSYHRVGP
jgi:hypothetical protein